MLGKKEIKPAGKRILISILCVSFILPFVSAVNRVALADQWFLVISDVHISSDSSKLEKLTGLVSEINYGRYNAIDFLVITGDCVSSFHENREKNLDDISNNRVMKLMQVLEPLQIPVYLVMGNHEYKIDRNRDSDGPFSHAEIYSIESMWTGLTKQEPYYSFRKKGMKYLVMNSMRGRPDEKHFDNEQLEWFRSELSGGEPVILFFHHPVKTDHIRIWAKREDMVTEKMDTRFMELLRLHREQIRGMFVGHGHMWVKDKLYGEIPVFETASFGEDPENIGYLVGIDSDGQRIVQVKKQYIRDRAQTVAFWAFDEPMGLYPSSVLSDQSNHDYPLILGKSGKIVKGKFGNALEACEPELQEYPEGEALFGLKQLPVPEGRTQEPMSWMNAGFSALMTRGEAHLRRQVTVPHPSRVGFNLGNFDWTIEFWYKVSDETDQYGIIFEVGSGPRGENNRITALQVDPGLRGFTFINGSPHHAISIPSKIPRGDWAHMAFTYTAEKKQISHYVNGRLQPLPAKFRMRKLPEGEEDYLSLARDGQWEHPLQGILDEMRFSEGLVYEGAFSAPGSFMDKSTSADTLEHTEADSPGPLLFDGENGKKVIELGNRKHLFIDDAMVSSMDGCYFTVNPPRFDRVVVEDIQGTFRKHVSVVEDRRGLIRIYYGGTNDCLEVLTSEDGVHFSAPDLGKGEYYGKRNVVLRDPSAMGNVFIDPKAPPGERWRFISDYNRRGIYLFSSRDGFDFTRMKTSILPFRSGSQSNSFYDDQQDKYISYHRCDFTQTPQGATRRTFVYTESDTVDKPWPFIHATLADYKSLEGKVNMRSPVPWYLDNGPLTPGGFSIEYPMVFHEIEGLDPPETDIYVPKAIKYPWAPDTYLAFPLLYFHYEESGTPLRTLHFVPERLKGSGPIETQLSVSRDAINWKRYPRPAYAGIGMYAGEDIKQAYLAHGLILRGDEIWQYCFGESRYHSSRQKKGFKREVYRLVQRLDGFVSIDSPYGKDTYMQTKPFRFEGNCLQLNLDTDAAGYIQVGFLDGEGVPIPGYTMDECIFLNGDFTSIQVEWMQNMETLKKIEINSEEDYLKLAERARTSKDLSSLEGRIVQMVFRMQGSKLYAMRFTDER